MKTTLLSLVVLIPMAMISTAAPGASRKSIIAHRGASGYLPEHTLEAVSMAYAMGADFLEQDVVLSRDDVPVVLHDINLALRYCSHGLLLLPDGRHRHGPLDAIITEAALEAVYGCAMREVRAGERRLFIPAD